MVWFDSSLFRQKNKKRRRKHFSLEKLVQRARVVSSDSGLGKLVRERLKRKSVEESEVADGGRRLFWRTVDQPSVAKMNTLKVYNTRRRGAGGTRGGEGSRRCIGQREGRAIAGSAGDPEATGSSIGVGRPTAAGGQKRDPR